jgi:MFS family permease
VISEYRSLFKNTKFLLLWNSQVLSQVTINILNFLTLATSLLWVSYALPAILFGPFASAVVDLTSRRKILVITNLLQSLIVVLFAFMPQSKPFLPYGIAFLYSFLNQFYVPAESASLPSLVPKVGFSTANSLFFFTMQGSLIIGYGFAGILESIFGFRMTLFLCATLLFLAFISVAFLPSMAPRVSGNFAIEQAVIRFFKSIDEGYHFILGHKKILMPFLMLIGLQIISTVVVVSVPQMAKDLLGIDVNAAGVGIIVPVAIGAIVSAFATSRLLRLHRRKKAIIENSFLYLTFLLLFLAFITPAIRNPALRLPLSIVAISLVGAFFVAIIISSQTYLQEVTPGGLRGRVFGNYGFLVTVLTIVPVIFSGAIVELFGVRLLLIMIALVAISAYVASLKFSQRIFANE